MSLAGKCGICCFALIFLIGIIIFSISWKVIQPTNYGLLYNTLTGTVAKNSKGVYEGGRHLIGPTMTFIIFPATAQTLTFSSAHGASSTPIQARTGGSSGSGVTSGGSGGQPVTISASFMYKIPIGNVATLYNQYATQYNSRFLQYARQTISNVAQLYQPNSFWMERSLLVEKMFEDLKITLFPIEVLMFQILQIHFAKSYEDNIISIQLAVQNKKSKEYQRQVVVVLKEIDILMSAKDASLTVINATAQANAKVIKNTASALAYNITQGAKIKAYSLLQENFNLTRNQLLKYMSVSMVSQHNSQKLTVGVNRLIN